MANLNFEKSITALLVIDPYKDFISEGEFRLVADDKSDFTQKCNCRRNRLLSLGDNSSSGDNSSTLTLQPVAFVP